MSNLSVPVKALRHSETIHSQFSHLCFGNVKRSISGPTPLGLENFLENSFSSSGCLKQLHSSVFPQSGGQILT